MARIFAATSDLTWCSTWWCDQLEHRHECMQDLLKISWLVLVCCKKRSCKKDRGFIVHLEFQVGYIINNLTQFDGMTNEVVFKAFQGSNGIFQGAPRIPFQPSQGDLGSGRWCNPYSKANAAVMCWMSSAGQHRWNMATCGGHGSGVVLKQRPRGRFRTFRRSLVYVGWSCGMKSKRSANKHSTTQTVKVQQNDRHVQNFSKVYNEKLSTVCPGVVLFVEQRTLP